MSFIEHHYDDPNSGEDMAETFDTIADFLRTKPEDRDAFIAARSISDEDEPPFLNTPSWYERQAQVFYNAWEATYQDPGVREQKILRESRRYQLALAAYGQFFQTFVTIPAFQEAIFQTQYKYLEHHSNRGGEIQKQFESVKHGIRVPLEPLANELLAWGIDAEFSAGQTSYKLHMTYQEIELREDDLSGNETDGKKTVRRSQIVNIKLDNGTAESGYDPIKQNRSYTFHHDFTTGNPPPPVPVGIDSDTYHVFKTELLYKRLVRNLAA